MPENQRLRVLLLLAAMVAVSAAIFAVDSRIPAGLAGGVPYAGSVILALWLPWRSSAAAAALACSALNLASFLVAAPAEIHWTALASRGLGIAVIWAAALVGPRLKGASETLERHVGARTGKLFRTNAALQKEIELHEQTYATLHQREAFLELVIDTSNALVILLGPDGRILEWSREAERLYGVSREDAIGLDYFDHFLPPDSIDSVRDAHRRMVECGETVRNADITVVTHDGEERAAIWSGASMRDTQGVTVGALGVGIDITERKRAEEELKERLRFEELLADLTARLVNATSADLDPMIRAGIRLLGEFMGVDRCTVDLFGEDGDRLSGAYIWQSDEFGDHAGPEPDRSELFARMPWFEEQIRLGNDIIVSRDRPFPEEAARELEVGRRHGIRSAAVVPMMVGGRAIGALGLSLLKEREREWPDALVKRLRLAAETIGSALLRKRTEEQLRRVTAESRSILETAVDAIATVHADGTITSLNPSAERMFGYSADELIGQSILNLTIAGDQPLYTDLITRYTETGVSQNYMDQGREMIGRRKDGSTLPVFVSMSTTEAGSEHLTVFVRDLTQEKALEQRLRAAASEAVLAEQRERKGLARDLHDGLGQLLSLASIKLGALRGAAGERGLKGRVREIEDVIGEADRRTTSLTFQLSPPVLDDVGLVAAAQWLAEDLERLYGLRISVEHDGGPTDLNEAGRVTLFRALRELLINVAKHAEVEKAWVQIQSRGQQLQVSVEDAGRGFLPKLETGGFGLLSLRERLEHLGGTLDIHSVPGEGTRIVASAPLNRKADVQREEEP